MTDITQLRDIVLRAITEGSHTISFDSITLYADKSQADNALRQVVTRIVQAVQSAAGDAK